jgi:hypothetical protein
MDFLAARTLRRTHRCLKMPVPVAVRLRAEDQCREE